MAWLVWVSLALAGNFRGDMSRTGLGDGSALVNNRVAWQRKAADRLLWPMSPVVANGVVLVGTGDGAVRAYTVDGAPLWRVALGGPVAAPPTVDGEDVYVADGAGGLWALSLGSGAVRWQVPLARGRVVGAPAVSDGLVACQGLDRVVRVVRAADGSVVWETTLDGAAEGAPTIVEGRLYLATADRKLRAWTLASGELLWEAALGSASRATVAVAEGLAVVGARDGTLRAFDALTGAERWSYAAGGFLDSSPAIADGVVYVGTSAGELHAVSKKGTRRWVYAAGSPVGGSPTVSGGTVIVGSTGGVVHVVDTKSGRAVFQVGVGGAVDGAASVVDGRAFVATVDGRVVGIGEPSFVELPPASAPAVVVAVDAPMWFGRRLYLGALGQVLIGAAGTASFLLGEDAGLLRSADGGLSWTTVTVPDGEAVRQVVSVAKERVLAVTAKSLIESADGGLTWKRLGAAPAGWGRRRLVHSRGKARLALGEDLLASADGGLAWSVVTPPGPVGAAVIHPLNPSVFVAAGPAGEVWRSADGGLRWEVLGTAPAPLIALDVSERDPARLLGAAADGSLLRSGDGGLTWASVTGPAGAPVRGLRWLPRSASQAYAALADGRVYATADGGLAWREVRYGLPEDQAITDIALDVGEDGGILVAVRLADGGGGAYRLGKVADHARLESVTFATGSAELGPSAGPVLDALFARMKADPTLRLRAEGHTDDVGKDEDNLVLSVARAKAVAEAAQARGLAPGRVITFGYGESRGIAPNVAEDGRAKNRRVELYLVRLP